MAVSLQCRPARQAGLGSNVPLKRDLNYPASFGRTALRFPMEAHELMRRLRAKLSKKKEFIVEIFSQFSCLIG